MPAKSDENRSIADRISLTIAATSDPRGLFCDFHLAYLPISPYEFASAGIGTAFFSSKCEFAGSVRDFSVSFFSLSQTSQGQRSSAANCLLAAGKAVTTLVFRLLLLCVCVWSVSQESRAETCGHYLFRNGVPVGVTAPKVTLPLQMTPAEHPPLAPQAPPCNGPGCRRQSVPLAPPATPGTRLLQSDPAVLLQALLQAPRPASLLPVPRSESGAVDRSSDIFRPPAA